MECNPLTGSPTVYLSLTLIAPASRKERFPFFYIYKRCRADRETEWRMTLWLEGRIGLSFSGVETSHLSLDLALASAQINLKSLSLQHTILMTRSVYLYWRGNDEHNVFLVRNYHIPIMQGEILVFWSVIGCCQLSFKKIKGQKGPFSSIFHLFSLAHNRIDRIWSHSFSFRSLALLWLSTVIVICRRPSSVRRLFFRVRRFFSGYI